MDSSTASNWNVLKRRRIGHGNLDCTRRDKRSARPSLTMTNRMRKWGWRISILLFLVASPALWAFFIEPNRLVIHRETIVVSNWPREFDGLRAAVLSDVHAGSSFIDKS